MMTLILLLRQCCWKQSSKGGALPCCRVDPFDPDSPIKALPVDKFPSDMFFVLRVVQLLRGLANAMDPDLEFSSVSQVPSQQLPSWTPACCLSTCDTHRMRRGCLQVEMAAPEVRCCARAVAAVCGRCIAGRAQQPGGQRCAAAGQRRMGAIPHLLDHADVGTVKNDSHLQ
jgi:hypothetical protein